MKSYFHGRNREDRIYKIHDLELKKYISTHLEDIKSELVTITVIWVDTVFPIYLMYVKGDYSKNKD